MLTQKQQRVIDLFTDVCVRDERILAAFIGGSIATATADEHSDLDLYALIQPEAYDQLLSQHCQFVEKWASPVFLEHFDGFGFDMLVFILQDGIQGELGIAKPDRFLLYGANILSTGRNRGWRLPEIIVDDTSQNILPLNQTFCTPLRA